MLDDCDVNRHTIGMKVAVSIPDTVFAKADALAKRLKLPRSRIYARALDEFVERHSPDRLTELANALADEMSEDETRETRQIIRSASRTALKHTEW